jgi:molecular chaperone GrpE (heat shock protein)
MGRPMTQPQEQQRHSDTAAIERVLKAERDGVSALQKSTKEAEQALSRARAEASDIARRTDSLISKLHAAYLRKIQNDLQQFATKEPLQPNQLYDADALAETARRVAARLTGGP